jgi:hypothetical protein
MTTPITKKRKQTMMDTPEEYWFKESYASKSKKIATGLFAKYYELSTLSTLDKEIHFDSQLTEFSDKDLNLLENACIEMKDGATNDSLGGLSLIASSKYTSYVAEINRLTCMSLQIRR